MQDDNLKDKGDHFHEESIIHLKIGNDQYNAFICDVEDEMMNKKDDFDSITRLNREDGSMIPQKE